LAAYSFFGFGNNNITMSKGEGKDYMLRFLIKKLKFWNAYSQNQRDKGQEQSPAQQPVLSRDLDKNLETIQQILGKSNDVKMHDFSFGNEVVYRGALIFIDGLVDSSAITEGVLKPLLSYRFVEAHSSGNSGSVFHEIRQSVLCNADIQEKEALGDLISGCLTGNTILLLDGVAKGLLVSTKGWEKRGVSEPQTESVIRGPREGFTENLRTNTALLRRKIKSTQLRMEHIIVGRKTLTDVCILYISGVADSKVVEEVKKRLDGLQVDSIMDAGYIEQYMEDAPFSMFATVGYTEKPDVAAAKMLEGRIAIVVDGSPFVLTVPMLFIESFQTAEDYYIRPFFASFTRLFRYLAFFVSVYAPAIYIALTTFHQELIPTTLLLTVAKAREGTPFPAFLEALIMVISFEILREAGLRLPRPVGQSISIVGALIMGDAAVSAGLVGAPLVIAVALTAVTGFVVPMQNDTASILRILSMVLAAVLGGYGIAMGFLATLVHLASLKSFGVPYFESLVPSRDLQDTLVRMPLWFMTKRPKDIAQRDTTRRHFFIPPLRPYETKPEPPQAGGDET
jgi:spore germination protein KA